MRQWRVHLIHHTHFDIGYTHTQQEVLDLQFRNHEQAMDLIDANRNRPENARFRWNPEATWALKEWLKGAEKGEIDRFVSLVESGYIGLDALFANMHTALCRPEELIRMMDGKDELEQLTGVSIDSAMITDVPGWNWGMVSALSEKGIRYLSAGTNYFDRIGYSIEKWGDKPFYWLSPSGKEKVLLWVHGKGYSWFHTGLNKTSNLRNKLRYRRIRNYLNSLERKNYPYDTVIIRYNIGSDNGPPDANLSSIVEEWNKKHKDIEMIISTTSAAMSEFEEKYGKDLPEYQGDFTAYWEDGALSTARETALARNAADRISLANASAALTGAVLSSHLREQSWESVLLFNEHTWGAHNSISRPDHPFARSQWDWKRQHALKADNLSREMLNLSMDAGLTNENKEITVYNTHSWPVSRLVEVRTDFSGISDSSGQGLPVQKLSHGKMAFIAEDLPPLGNRVFRFNHDSPPSSPEKKCSITEGDLICLKNNNIKISIDKKTGIIQSIRFKGQELVDNKRSEHFNAYVRVPGKFVSLKKTEKRFSPVHIETIENGPLLITLRIKRKAPLCRSFITDICLHAGSDEIFITNTLDRPVARKKEGIHFAYPLNIPEGRLYYDTAWGLVEADTGQLTGANRNVLYPSRRVDIVGNGVGLSAVLLDAPAVKTGKLVHDPIRTGPAKLCGWLESNPYDGRFYSYVMNNYWKTNFKADQPGETSFRYVFRPFDTYDSSETYRGAMEITHTPVIVSGRSGSEELPCPENIRIGAEEIRRDGDRIMIRLVNSAETGEKTQLIFKNHPVPESRLRVLSKGKEANLSGSKITLASSETILIEVRETESC